MVPSHGVPASSLSNEEDEACLRAMLFSSSNVFPMVLTAATKLSLFDIIAQSGPNAQLSPSEIASHLASTSANMASELDRMLRLLASHSLLTCSLKTLGDGRVERLYSLTSTSRFFVEKEGEESLTSLLALSCHPASHQVWLHFMDAVVEGGNQFSKVHGMPMFEYTDADPSFKTVFHKAMVGRSTIIMKKVLQVYNGFEGLNSLVDVAGGTGKCLDMVISKYPSIKGINFDLPNVTKEAPSYPGIEHVGGSMFSSIPKADAIMMKDVLHNWSDENCLKVLENCFEALPSKGKVIIVEVLPPEAPETTMSSMYRSVLDNIMLLFFGGKERTERELKALSEAAGFSDFKVVCCACEIWSVMELYKS